MAGGSQIIINKNGIRIITPAKFEVNAGQHLFKRGTKVSMQLPFLPEGTHYNLKYLFTDDDGIPYKNIAYTATYPNGSEIKGITDQDGYSSTFFSSEEKDIQIHLELE
ncbi:hypothetical protein [Acinetobacter gerneri]|uniref:DUF2345 domain-containing protein n=1 Tax=Acinetobacter gerneri DSM 14967 = CIP 107464 = MTCC 9824 TaxID=1120926 RepID=N8ZT92_9GAMM|nr:hypothetical protein [Acinetobacter gerneri]ENV34963.1 hypothetical protein F960_00934 [Acinetobacter gerneri DSM 14967 = CIP 107464 = MTCC 9824]EPR81455.1 hypothetical protein L289_3623 [Acinetobacter gerneri DSM 14967 = CIP 107464 = MTCC 9824]MDV2441849.1 hypothetical protein [Acinetobacter gerneri]